MVVQQNRVRGGLSFQQMNVSISQSDFCTLSLISTVYQLNQPFRFNGTVSWLCESCSSLGIIPKNIHFQHWNDFHDQTMLCISGFH